MSNQTYNELWAEAQTILEDTTYTDNIQISSKPSRDKKQLHKQISIIFLKYILAINKLAECYDQMVHPQKRILIRKILDASIIRYLELKSDLVNLVLSEFTHLDDGIEELGLLPHDTELQIPECYRRERKTDIEWKYKFVEETLTKIGLVEEKPPGIQMTEEEAILLIQRHERARQCRMRFVFMKNIRETKDRVKSKASGQISEVGRKAALKIQRVWRGFITRRKIRKRVIDEMLLIGMLEPDCFPTEERELAERLKLERYEIQQKHDQEYQDALIREKENIQKYRGNIIMEEIRDEVRNWYLMYKQQTGKFPTIPSEESGGSAAVVGRQSPLPGSSEGSRSTAPPSIESKSSRSKKSSDNQEEKKKKVNEDDDLGFKLSASHILSDLEAVNSEYEEVWKDLEERDNPEQNYVTEMVRAQKVAEVEAELRKIVDVQLRAELENLQSALERDEKGRRTKKPSKKKTRRGLKKSKKKKDKDLTPDRTLESLFEELVVNGIIRKYPLMPLSSYLGEMSCTGYVYQSQGKNVMPSLGDVRQAIRDYCILPMSSTILHETAPLNRSLLIAGPRDSGKDMLVHAICSEIGAVLFDLTAVNIAGKYPGKAGLIMLIHLINKVSKLLQPAVIYIDDAEKTFLKKVPKTDKTDPKRLKKDLSKIVKSIGPTDLVMLIGVTHCPWECDQKSLIQTYGKLIMILRPDYTSLNSIWTYLLHQYNAFNHQLNLGMLTKLSDGYTVGTIFKVMQRLMTCKRTLRLKIHQLKLTEILEVLAQFEPIYKEEEDAFLQWYSKTPLGKSSQRALELEMEMIENDERNKKPDKSSKKK